MRRYIPVFFILALLAVPFAGAASLAGREGAPIATERDFNISSADSANMTIPARFQATQEPVRIGITVSDTIIPGPKGEMQAGPRAIGFVADPVTLVLATAGIIVVIAGLWYLARRKPAEEEGQENGGDR